MDHTQISLPDHLSALGMLLVLGSSLFGSLHCLTMCGPIVAFSIKNWAQATGYHIGRWIGYLLVTSIGLALGTSLRIVPPWLKWTALVLFSLVIFIQGWNIFFNSKSELRLKFLDRWILPLWKKVTRLSDQSPWGGFAIGFLTPLLPCGWLYTFVAQSIFIDQPKIALIWITAFWLGTLPVMIMGPTLIQKTINSTALIRFQKIAGILLMISAIVSLYAKVQLQNCCHH